MVQFPPEKEAPKEIKYPQGFKDRVGHTKIAVSFPTPLFDAIIEIAKREKKTFNEMVVYLVACGKLDLEESDVLEPEPEPKPAPNRRRD